MKKFLLYTIVALFLTMLVSGQNSSPYSLYCENAEIKVIPFKTYYYASFDLNEPGKFKLDSKTNITSVEISPKSYGVAAQKKGNHLEFTLERPGYYMIRINETVKLFLFAEKPELIPGGDKYVNIIDKYSVDNSGKKTETGKIQRALDEISGSGKILYFPAGIYQSGQLQIKSNSSVHFARGATLRTDTTSIDLFKSKDEVSNKRFISMYNVENITLSGYGSIDGNGRVLRTKFGDDGRMRLLMAIKSRNIDISGLHFKDPGSWNTQVLFCNDIQIKNVKLLNDIELSNTDGFDPDATRKMLIEDCFAYCGDDNVAVKTTAYGGLVSNVDQITVRGCVFLTKKSSLKVGTETRCEVMSNILFENNDVIECDRGIALYVSDGATLSNIIYKNNRFDRNHPDQQKRAIHIVVSKRNPDSKLGEIKNALISNCSFAEPFPNKSLIKYEGEGKGIHLTIENLEIAGQKIQSLEPAKFEVLHSVVIQKRNPVRTDSSEIPPLKP